MQSGFPEFLSVIGFFVLLGITLTAVYVAIRLIEQIWPRRDRPRVQANTAPLAGVRPAPVAPVPTFGTPAQVVAPAQPAPAGTSSEHEEGEVTAALRVLELRLANGDIDIADYQSRRDALGGTASDASAE